MMFIKIVCLMSFAVFFIACTKPISSTSSSSEPTTTAAWNGQLSGSLLPKEGAAVSTIANAKIEIQSHPELTTTSDAEGRFSFANVPPGNQTVFISSAVLGLSGKVGVNTSAAADYGLRIKDVLVVAGQSKNVGTQQLKSMGAVSGKIDFYQNPNGADKTGSDVYIPGTSFIAKTDSTGNFTLAGIPVGDYTIRADHTGFASSDIESVIVTEGASTNIGTRYLSISTGPEGQISVVGSTVSVGGYPVIGSRSVTLNLTYDNEAVLMLVDDESSFVDAQWEVVSATKAWPPASSNGGVYSSDGLKHVYIKFANLNGLESPPVHVAFIVDTENPVVNSLALMHGWPTIASTAYDKVPIDIAVSDSGSGTEQMMICNTSDFSGCAWENYAAVKNNWALSGSGLGNKTVYIKVKDYLGHVSSSANDSITVDNNTLLPTSCSEGETITLNKDQGPYTYDDTLSYDCSLTINAGTILKYPDQKDITVRGVLAINGTSTDYVVLSPLLGTNKMGVIDLSTGEATNHSINYFQFGSSFARAGTSQLSMGNLFKFNGGSIRNSRLYINSTGADIANGLIYKIGMRPFSVITSQIYNYSRGAGLLWGAGTNITLDHNEITLDPQDTFSNTVIYSDLNSSAEIKYNTVMYYSTNTMTNFKMFLFGGGSLNIHHNHLNMRDNVTHAGADANPFSVFKNANAATVANIYHNNLLIKDDSHFSHFDQSVVAILNGGTGVNANWYGSCSVCSGANAYCGVATDVATGAASLYSTTAGVSGCVGNLCVGTE